jgi:hypothetical protein
MDRQTDRQTGRRRVMAKLIVTFRVFTNAPKNYAVCSHIMLILSCTIWFLQQGVIIATQYWLVFVKELQCVFCELGIEPVQYVSEWTTMRSIWNYQRSVLLLLLLLLLSSSSSSSSYVIKLIHKCIVCVRIFQKIIFLFQLNCCLETSNWRSWDRPSRHRVSCFCLPCSRFWDASQWHSCYCMLLIQPSPCTSVEFYSLAINNHYIIFRK